MRHECLNDQLRSAAHARRVTSYLCLPSNMAAVWRTNSTPTTFPRE